MDCQPLNRTALLPILGIFAGILMGPWVFGRWCPDTYERWSIGGVQERRAVEASDKQRAMQRQRLEGTGVTAAAIEEFDRVHHLQHDLLAAQLDLARAKHLQRLAGRAAALVLALAAVMFVEACSAGRAVPHGAMGIRHVLWAVWFALVLAQPGVLGELPVVTVSVLVLIVVLQGWVFQKKERGCR